jgi:hypothetical protein
VLQLFTTDNLLYNPKLYLDYASQTLQFNSKSLNANIQTHVTRLTSEFEKIDFHLSYEPEVLEPARYFSEQALSTPLRPSALPAYSQLPAF